MRTPGRSIVAVVVHRGAALAAFVAVLGGATPAAAADAYGDVEALTQRVSALVERSDPAASRAVAAVIERGLPPAVLVRVLELLRQHPRLELAEALRQLTQYRSVAVRGRALAALAAVGPLQLEQAILIGVDDPDRRIRRLAYELGVRNRSPVVELALQRMLAREAAVATNISGDATSAGGSGGTSHAAGAP